jgi:hypothetical protein
MQEQSTIPPGLCQCGCGQPTRVARMTNRAKGHVKGQPNRYTFGHHGIPAHPLPEYVVDPDTACWLWARGLTYDGYGQLRQGKRQRKAHQIFYERYRGPIPAGMTIDHLCHNADVACVGGKTCLHRHCVNPAHLEAVTIRVNTARGRTITALNAGKTHCKHGHPFDASNTLIERQTGGGYRRACHACQLVRKARWRLKKKHG